MKSWVELNHYMTDALESASVLLWRAQFFLFIHACQWFTAYGSTHYGVHSSSHFQHLNSVFSFSSKHALMNKELNFQTFLFFRNWLKEMFSVNRCIVITGISQGASQSLCKMRHFYLFYCFCSWNLSKPLITQANTIVQYEVFAFLLVVSHI